MAIPSLKVSASKTSLDHVQPCHTRHQVDHHGVPRIRRNLPARHDHCLLGLPIQRQ